VVQHHSKPGKVGVLLMHGTADQVVAYGGKQTSYLSAEDTYSYWLKQNGIGSAGISRRVIDGDASDGTDVTWVEQGNGQQSVALVTIREGGHTWPGADPFNVGLPIGKTTRDIDANEVIWQFLGKHRR
jgi:polyhydroxybutyrate depolymerase